MTREEALKILKNDTVDTSDDWCEAFEIAINALEQEPCEDAISREKTMQIVRKWFDRNAVPSDLKNEIEQLPPVQPKQRKREMLLPCTCGRNSRTTWTAPNYYQYECNGCGRLVSGKTQTELRENWNDMIREEQGGSTSGTPNP